MNHSFYLIWWLQFSKILRLHYKTATRNSKNLEMFWKISLTSEVEMFGKN